VSSITIISDALNCGVTYDRHYDDHNSFIIQATKQTLVNYSHKKFYNIGPCSHFVAFDASEIKSLKIEYITSTGALRRVNFNNIFATKAEQHLRRYFSVLLTVMPLGKNVPKHGARC
jgi:hypothetical protein